MIHEFREEFLDLPLQDYVLTYDDGLYTQYMYDHLIDATKIYFVSTNIICQETQTEELISCRIAHERAFRGDKSAYMNLQQIETLLERGNYVGGHSHYHKHLKSFSSLAEKVNHIKQDTELMLEWFEKNLHYQPTKFCFPYNDDMNGMYPALLKKYGFTEFYGNERIPIEKLLRN